MEWSSVCSGDNEDECGAGAAEGCCEGGVYADDDSGDVGVTYITCIYSCLT